MQTPPTSPHVQINRLLLVTLERAITSTCLNSPAIKTKITEKYLRSSKNLQETPYLQWMSKLQVGEATSDDRSLPPANEFCKLHKSQHCKSNLTFRHLVSPSLARWRFGALNPGFNCSQCVRSCQATGQKPDLRPSTYNMNS